MKADFFFFKKWICHRPKVSINLSICQSLYFYSWVHTQLTNERTNNSEHTYERPYRARIFFDVPPHAGNQIKHESNFWPLYSLEYTFDK